MHVPSSPSYRVDSSQLVRFAHVCTLVSELLKQEYRNHNLLKTYKNLITVKNIDNFWYDKGYPILRSIETLYVKLTNIKGIP